MTLTQLEYILAIEPTGNFSRAAEECHVTQPSLSTQVMKLEEELAVRLFERDRRQVTITDAGREILDMARRVLNETQRIHDIALSYQKDIRGTLRLGIIPTIGPYLLPVFSAALAREHKDLLVEISEDKTEALMEGLDKGRLDAAILSTPRQAPESLLERVLYYEPFCVFAHQGHPLLAQKTFSLADLESWAPSLLDDTHCMRDQLTQICDSQLREGHGIKLKVGTLQTLMQLVDQQQSFTLIPSLARKSLSAAQQKEQIKEFIEPIPTRKVSLVYHRSFLKKPLIEALFKILQSHIPSGVLAQAREKRLKILDPGPQHFLPPHS
ncbi:MAG: LysR substrate-binding domain-containing protein [Pseudobdellovibrionaceae bacterium]|nr:LysR substrate-binding domain-containing protein [Pseudobdellovibrionaceae bacterium]